MLLDTVRNTCVRLDSRMDRLESRMDRLEDRMDRRFEAVDVRFDTLERKMDQGFRWLVGIHITTFVAIAAAMLAR
jgi:chaperonin cofactor prefoldin